MIKQILFESCFELYQKTSELVKGYEKSEEFVDDGEIQADSDVHVWERRLRS